MKELIGIESILKNNLRIEIGICNVCNYHCPYCYEKDMLGIYDKHLDYNMLIEFFEMLSFEKQVYVFLSGGEPTLHPFFLDILDYFNSRDFNVAVVSNASRSKEWWEKVNGLHHASISYHYSDAKFEEFVEKVNCISEKTMVTVNVMAPKEDFNTYVDIFYEISKRCRKNTYVMLKPVMEYNESDYTTEESSHFKLLHPSIETIKVVNEGKLIKKYRDGSEEVSRPINLLETHENEFKGWKCWAGVDVMRIWPNGDIYKASCKIPHENMGNIYNLGDFRMPTEPIICDRDTCICMPEVRIKKEKV